MNLNYYTLEASSAATGTQGGMQSMLVMVIYLAVIFGAMYFLLIRPQRKKQKEGRSRAAAEILTMIGQFVNDYGQLSICNEAGEISIDSYNISAVTINWDTEDD